MNWILHAVIGLLGYFVMGRFGLMLAIPPGFASSVWPAAGFALAAVMLLNRSAASIGIALGSFLLNLSVAVPGIASLTLDSLYVPASIALGTYIQVQFLLLLYRMTIGTKLLPDRIKDVIFLMLLVAPLGCLFSATFGAGTLYLFQVIPEQALLFTWFTWWTGDTIGVLLFAPMLLAACSPRATLSIVRKAQVVLPVLVVFSLILVFFFTSIQSRNALNKQESERVADYFFNAIDKRFDLALSRLQSFEAFVMSSADVTEHQFQQFASKVLQGDLSVKAVGWTEMVARSERERVQAGMKTISGQPFGFTEINRRGELVSAEQREVHYPVLYIHPLQGNERAYGLDLGFNPSRVTALKKARQSGLAVATEPIRLVQETDEQFAFVLYIPVSRPNPSRQSMEFLGFVSGVFRVQSMLGDLINQAQAQGLDISIRDLSRQPDEGWLLEPSLDLDGSARRFNNIITVGTRSYEVALERLDRNVISKDWNSWWVMTAGVMFAILLQSLILIITGNVAAVERLVSEKTRKLEEALLEADRANVAKSNFLSNISHELRTPLNAIINLIRMSADAKPGQPVESYLFKANLASETLMSLINHTLDFNKIESGKIELESTSFDLLKMIEKLYVLFSMMAEEKGLTLEMDFPEHLPQQLVGDPLRLEQILTNICSNAIKFTEQGKVTMAIELGERTATKLNLLFEITDTGIGIAREHQDKLFQPFHQADGTTTRRFGGSGLGLSISKRLVELMDGSIALQSQDGKGSTFAVSLPFELPADARFVDRESILQRLKHGEYEGGLMGLDRLPSLSLEAEAPAPSEQDAGSKVLAGRHALVVEDVEMNQFIAQHMLENAGAKVTIAGNGEIALECIDKDSSIDVVLMDIQMPVMDGYQATQELRSRFSPQELPIIAMTANAMQHDIDRCMEVGMNGHLGKPVDETAMVAMIVEHLPEP